MLVIDPPRNTTRAVPPAENTQLPSGMQIGTGVRIVSTQKEFTEGSLQVTDNAFDIAINGRGFFEVLLPDGTTAYTRNGQFQLSRDGEQRRMLLDLDTSIQSLTTAGAERDSVLRLTNIYHNLLRRWAEP